MNSWVVKKVWRQRLRLDTVRHCNLELLLKYSIKREKSGQTQIYLIESLYPYTQEMSLQINMEMKNNRKAGKRLGRHFPKELDTWTINIKRYLILLAIMLIWINKTKRKTCYTHTWIVLMNIYSKGTFFYC